MFLRRTTRGDDRLKPFRVLRCDLNMDTGAHASVSHANSQVGIPKLESSVSINPLGKQVESRRVLLAAQSERARLAQLRFDHGRSTYLEVLDAQRDLFDAEQALVQVRRAELASIVSLYSGLGGGMTPAREGDATQQQGEGRTP